MKMTDLLIVRPFIKMALCTAAALALSACASDPGEKGVDEPFPNLADVPPSPQASTTAQERKALKAQLERRRDEVENAAASLLRGGTEPVPVDLDSQVPQAPDARRSKIAPPPLPSGLPKPPERPESLSAGGTSANPEQSSQNKANAEGGDDGVIKAPEEDQMPPARAAGEAEDSGADGAEEGEDAQDGG